jgi:hypothetical protein
MKDTMKPLGVVVALAIICLIAATGCSTERDNATGPGLRSTTDAAAPVALGEHHGHTGPILYSTSGFGATGQLVRINVDAGTATPIGVFGELGNTLALAISPEGEIYTVTQGFGTPNTNPQLARVDLATGDVTPFGRNLAPLQFMGIGFSSDGKLYGVNTGTGWLYKFNVHTGAAKKVGETPGCGDIMDLAWHDGQMYGAAWDKLFRINLHTGQAEMVATFTGTGAPTNVMGLAIDDDGNFYVTGIMPGSPLWRVDPITGAVTAVPGVSVDSPHGLECMPADGDHGGGGHDGDDHTGPIFYAASNGATSLDRIDVGAGTVTPVGPFGIIGGYALAISPEGDLYTATRGNPYPSPANSAFLARVNPATGVATPFGVTHSPENFMGLGFSPSGKLYGVNAGASPNGGSLYQFNLHTGAATKVDITGGCGMIMDLAWHDGKMYGAAPHTLYRVNLQTGLAEVITELHGLTGNAASPLGRVMGLAIDDDGEFYVTEILPNSPLFRVDLNSGMCTAVPGVLLNLSHGLECMPRDGGDGGHDD